MASTPNSYLIDTSILIPYIRQSSWAVERLNALADKFTSPTVVAELVFGGMRSINPRDGIQRVNRVVRSMPIVAINRNIGYGAALMKNRLVASNELIPDNDIWIAATAM